jgi:hypothetical protein
MRSEQFRQQRTPLALGGHKMYCTQCGSWQIHSFSMSEDSSMLIKCRRCSSTDTMVYAGGYWIPTKMVPSMDAYVQRLMKEASIVVPEAVTEDILDWKPEAHDEIDYDQIRTFSDAMKAAQNDFTLAGDLLIEAKRRRKND